MVSPPEKLTPSEDVRRTTLTTQGPFPDEFGGAATGVPTVFVTFWSDMVGFFFARRTLLPELKFLDTTALVRSGLVFVGSVALDGVAKLTITNTAAMAMFVFMNLSYREEPIRSRGFLTI